MIFIQNKIITSYAYSCLILPEVSNYTWFTAYDFYMDIVENVPTTNIVVSGIIKNEARNKNS